MQAHIRERWMPSVDGCPAHSNPGEVTRPSFPSSSDESTNRRMWEPVHREILILALGPYTAHLTPRIPWPAPSVVRQVEK